VRKITRFGEGNSGWRGFCTVSCSKVKEKETDISYVRSLSLVERNGV
jgi:hypothetical protein